MPVSDSVASVSALALTPAAIFPAPNEPAGREKRGIAPTLVLGIQEEQPLEHSTDVSVEHKNNCFALRGAFTPALGRPRGRSPVGS